MKTDRRMNARAVWLERAAKFYRFKTDEVVKLCDESDFNMAVECCLSAKEFPERQEQARWVRVIQMHVARSLLGKRRAKAREKELKGISVSRRELTGPVNPAKLCNVFRRLEEKRS